MSWISPTGFNDSGSGWSDEPFVYDNDILSFAYTSPIPNNAWSEYLELTLPDYVFCDAIRFNAALPTGISSINVDIYYDGGWNTLYSGIYTGDVWETKDFTQLRRIDKARVRFRNTGLFPQNAKFFEFAFKLVKHSLIDTNELIRTYLLTSTTLTDPLIALIGSRLYCPRLPEGATLPAISYFTRGGIANPEVTSIFSPSVQFDCWASSSIAAREIYRVLYDALHGLDNTAVIVNGVTNHISKAREETQGQDLVDVEIPNYFRVMTFYAITIRDNL